MEPKKNYVKGLLSMVLGLWLWTMPYTFCYSHPAIDWNDGICGIILFGFGFLYMFRPHLWVEWIMCFLGLWLQVAPLIFWYPDAAGYINDTIIGILAIVISVIIPSKPFTPEKASHTPPGWSYNPSSWIQRLPIVTLALICWMISRYLAAFQLGYIPMIWDPVFGDGTLRVLTSDVSRAWPVSDAGLGAFSYTIDALMGCQGDTKRWCSSPWTVVLFGILVIPLGVISIGLIILQPVAVGAWCFFCLITAICMLLMVSLTVDEVVASLQFLRRCHKEGKSFWKVFWAGDRPPGNGSDKPAAPASLKALFWGVSAPWNLLLMIVLGGWLMASPTVFRAFSEAANNYYVLGALTITLAVIALAEVSRSARFVAIAFGLWLFAAPWLLHGETPMSQVNSHIVGVLLILLAYPKGKLTKRYGTYTKRIV